jgi:hypothetical protein
LANRERLPGEVHMVERRRNTYIACQDYNLTFHFMELHSFYRLWESGHSILNIAKSMGRHVNEITLLIVEQAYKKKVGKIGIVSAEPFCFESRDGRTYTACEEFNFIWDLKQLWKFRAKWQEGLSIREIAKELKRKVIEVFILALDQMEHGKISARAGGLYGQAV